MHSTNFMEKVYNNKPENVLDKATFEKQQLVDFEADNQFLRLYLGDAELEDWFGDDWNDIPYEHNAGTVYTEYIDYVVDLAFPASCVVLEPCAGVLNSSFAKDDMKAQSVPMVIVTDDTDKWGDLPEIYNYAVGSVDAYKVYMKMNAYEVINLLIYRYGAQIMTIYKTKDED